ncbi:MAG: response regulator, partial [Algicola sp.]|nr:response regulator [Algicola sp.]
MRVTLLLLILMQPMLLLAAQTAVRFERLGIEDGLSQSVGLSIVQDNQGYMWFGTTDGLNRYDGYQFKQFRYNPNDASSVTNNWISVIYEDSVGQLWIGTEGGGINRYDRKTQRFSHLINNSNDPTSLSHNVVTAIGEDAQGGLWIGTLDGGVNRYDAKKDAFERFYHDSVDNTSLSHNSVRVIYNDSKGNLWIGTDGGGLNRYDAKNNQFVSYQHDAANPNSISHNSVYAIHEDSQGRLWIGTFGGGLNRFDSYNQTFKRFKHQTSEAYTPGHENIRTINEDLQGVLWIGTDDGLSLFDKGRKNFVTLRNQLSDPFSLGNNSIRSIYVDGQGLVWLGTFGGGINLVDFRQSQFGHVKHDASDDTSLGDNFVFTMHLDAKNALWVGTFGGGIHRQVSPGADFEHFLHQPDNPDSLSNDYVWSINEDRDGTFWVGTMGGPNQMDTDSGKFKPFEHQLPAHSSLSGENISAILKDASGVLWLGTRGQGIIRFDQGKGEYIRYKHQVTDPFSLSNNVIMTIFEDSKGVIWIGTHNGMNRYDEKGKRFERFVHDPKDPVSLSQGFVATIFEDDRGIIWVGSSGGLNKFDGSEFVQYRESDGLANSVIYCVIQDNTGLLWMSTNLGLSNFEPDTGKFNNYDVDAGLQSNEFNLSACTKSDEGELFFGGINGFNRFFPENLNKDKKPPVVVFTDFLVFNKKVAVQSNQSKDSTDFVLSQAIDQVTDITLTHRQNLVSFEFAALDYHSPMKNGYQYMLEGYDEEWIGVDAKIRRATYTNLPSGDFTLRVKASNADGYWNEQGASISIEVRPAPWFTWWAFVLYIGLIVLIIYAIVHNHIEHSKMRHELSLVDRLKQLDRLKDAFLANTSHELRTPINGIIGLAESLIDGVAGKMSDDAKRNLRMVVTSGKRLSRLVNDILDMSKLKHGGVELHTQALDLHSLVDVVLTLSKPLVAKKDVELVNDVARSLPAVEADEDRLLQILHNLVGNGVKFTDSGIVSVTAQIVNDRIRVSVQDSGIGIPDDKLDTIFESFAQVQNDNARSYGGTGLGLTITKQLVELHSGRIEVTSIPEKGSTFSFTLASSQEKPTGRIAVRSPQVPSKPEPVQAVPIQSKPIQSKSVPPQTVEPAPVQTKLQPKPGHINAIAADTASLEKIDRQHDGSGFRLLIVDDEPINLQVLHNILSMENYLLVEAQNGIEALEIMKNDGPFDMVLLDIMMPKMSGYEVCETLRKTYSVSELPIIFLTAKNQVEDLICGFELGANDHLSKPVTKHELLSRVEIHLKMHDINRNLDKIVNERTAQIVATQKKLVLSEKLASLGTLMAGVAHEINNPTNFVHVSVQNMEADLARCRQFIFDLAGDDADEEILESFRGQFDPLTEHLETIKEGTTRIKTIVKDLKTSSHMNEEDQSEVCITDILVSTVNLVSTQYKGAVEIVTEFDATPFITCYP